MRRALALLPLGLPVALTACGVLHHHTARQTPAPRSFNLAGFFTGETRGTGRLTTPIGRARPIRVESSGRIEQGDMLVLDQTVTEGRKPARKRQWRLRETAPGLWIGSLSDADGPVVAEVAGPRVAVSYPMRGGLAVRQTLTLQPDGRTAINRMDVSKAKLHVASVVETIVKP